jgi:Ca-activated chloride channel family protein
MNADDPKFTAYALDELDPAERAAIEAELRAQPALAAELEEMRRFTAQLRGELHAEEGAPLLPAQRAAVLGQASRIVAGPRSWWRRSWVQSSAAASVIVGALAGIIAHLEVKTPRVEKQVIRNRSMQLSLEPESEAKSAPSDYTGLPSAPFDLASPAKPSFFGGFAPGTGRLSLDGTVNKSAGFVGASPISPPVAALNISGGSFSAGSTQELSKKQVDALVQADPYNIRARRLQEKIHEAEDRANGRSYAEARGRAMWQYDRGLSKDTYGFASAAPAPESRARRVKVAGLDAGLAKLGDQDAPEPPGTEAYDAITDNAFLTVKSQPLSTFSIDVDTASYANVRRFLNANERPPRDAVRIEELVNYFRYNYPQPEGAAPFACALEVATCPWQTEHRLVRIGLKGREIKRENRPASNLVFLIDVSGSMQPENRLPLVKQSLRLLIDQLTEEDTVAIAVYAGNSGCVLEPTHDRDKMRAALDRLEAGGSTNGAAGIQLAYDLAQRSFKKGGTNRVILCTDGDFNVGVTNQGELVSMIQDKAKTGIFLSVFGVGMGNLKDATLEKLADKGNGNYAYIDTLAEGRRVFVEQMSGTLFTIAKDVKVQVEFNPAQVAAYRLLGYENRLLAKEDFNDDTKDAGEIGAGHTVTALYEVVPAGKAVPDASAGVDELKYQGPVVEKLEARNPKPDHSPELLTVKVRYKQPDGDVSRKLEFPLTDNGATWEKSSRDFRWAASVASFGLLLRDSPHKGGANWNMTLELANEGKGDDRDGYRAEFAGLVEKARALSR